MIYETNEINGNQISPARDGENSLFIGQTNDSVKSRNPQVREGKKEMTNKSRQKRVFGVFTRKIVVETMEFNEFLNFINWQLLRRLTVGVCLLSIISLLANLNITAQSSATAGQPAGLKSGSALGSYGISELENINLYNGNMSFRLPLFTLGSRGEAAYTATLPLGSYWDYQYELQPNAPLDRITRFDLLETRLRNGTYYSPGGMYRRDLRWAPDVCDSPSQLEQTLTNFYFIAGDGTQYDFRDTTARDGSRNIQQCGPREPRTRGREFVSTDGSGMTYYSDAEVIDYEAGSNGTLVMKSGVRYRIEGGQVRTITDRNGNKISFTYDTNVYPARVTSVTDQSQRQISIQYAQQEPEGTCDRLTYKGFGGADRTIKVCSTKLENALRPNSGYAVKTLGELFGTAIFQDSLVDPNTVVNGNVVSAVYLPDNRSYKFYYNSYSELARVVMPNGGAIEYDWRARSGEEYGGAYREGLFRRLTERRVYADGNNLEGKTLYPIPYFDLSGNFGPVEVRQQEAAGNTLSLERHHFQGSPYRLNHPYASYEGYADYPVWSDGLETKTEYLSADGTAVLRSIDKEWEQTLVSWWVYDALYAPPNNPRVKSVTTTLSDVSPSLVSKTTMTYDNSLRVNKLTDTYEYDFGAGAPGAFLRRSHTDYVTDPNYTSESVRLTSLPSQMWVSSDEAGNNKVSLTQMEYDNYANDASHAPLVDRANVSGHDTTNFGAGYPWRGNVTAVTSFANAAAQTDPVTAFSQYDILGNVVKAIDAKGNTSTISYNDNFGAPDAEARTNSAPSQLNGQSTFAFATSATNPQGWTTYAQFDYFTGASIDTEDINGVVSSNFYNDPLDRLTQSIIANNLPAHKQQTTIAYDDTNRKITTTSDLFTFGDNLSKSESFYDGLGRTTEARKYEENGGYIATMTEYDALSRVKRATNPYRPQQSEPQLWTTSAQAGKQRRSLTNGLGQLVRVDEPDDAGNLGTVDTPNQPTSYAYDTLGNLGVVTQGVQTRTFQYDSLSRLKQATNPESGTISYAYDANGNLTGKTDARSVTTSYSYDNLNRVLSRTYSDTAMPNVSYTYDDANIQYAKGRLTKVSSSVSETRYNSFDNLGRVTASQQITDGQTYNFGYAYNLAGMLTEETYPSGRKVKNTFQTDGDLSKIETLNAGGSYATRADNFSYTAAGAISAMQLGNAKWENAQFNSRLQPIQLGLGTSSTDTSLWRVSYDYGTTDNNGNVKQQTITVPTINPLVQTYTYDSLNRIKSAVETENSNQTWKQTFSYDRYGNRNFDAANTTTLGNCPAAQCNPSIDAQNNRFTTNQGYTYDLSGNLITDAQNRSFVYDAENKQKEVKDAANVSIGQYFYDGDGKRVKKVAAQETTLFAYDASGRLAAEYLLTASTPLPPTTSYLTTDTLGSPRVITNQTGNVTSRRDFMPFGEEIPSLGNRTSAIGYQADSTRQKFTGYERDIESNLDFAQARIYTNKSGRFSTPDPLLASAIFFEPQSWNRYSYVLNNPIIIADPTGLCPPVDDKPCEVGDIWEDIDDVTGKTFKLIWDGENWFDTAIDKTPTDDDVSSDAAKDFTGMNRDTFITNHAPIDLGSGWRGRLDKFESGETFEIQVYNPKQEDAGNVSGRRGWIGKHGKPDNTPPPNIPRTTLNRINGLNVEELRKRGMIDPEASVRHGSYLNPGRRVYGILGFVHGFLLDATVYKRANENGRSLSDQYNHEWQQEGKYVNTVLGPMPNPQYGRGIY